MISIQKTLYIFNINVSRVQSMGRNAIIMIYRKARNITGIVTPDMFHVFGIISKVLTSKLCSH